MGIYLGQLPPAEIARLKAELAETLIANFCYPRFFDNRVEALRMRPVDRAKRQEVWLFLSSVDFTSWSRIDLTTPDLQHQVERLFIQFVQRNRAFFGQQGRKRMPDVRLLINSSASSVVLGLRGHLSGQRQGNTPFGSPRPAASWLQHTANGCSEPAWEQIAPATMALQQQLQELRGEVRPSAANGASTNGTSRGPAHMQPAPGGSAGKVEQDGIAIAQMPTTILTRKPPTTRKPATTLPPAASAAASTAPPAPETPVRKAEVPTPPPAVQPVPVVEKPIAPPMAKVPPTTVTNNPLPPETPVKKSDFSPVTSTTKQNGSLPSVETVQPPTLPPAPPTSAAPVQSRSAMQVTPPAPSVAASVTVGPRDATMMAVGEDDIAIFEQLRHQMLIWLRVEAIRAGLDISSSLATAQLLDMLRQQAHLDETRLQVISTLLNLSNQVIKTGMVTILDYKQALMFHLMHTRR
ncbi:MAG: hypothetical protein M3Y39_05045 [Chloroflexota bacterium]|nr:hypothetical protein [Chloroflexota bacterium]